MYKTINELSAFVKQTIDSHWSLEISEEELISIINSTFSDIHNRELAFRGTSFSPTFERKLGTERSLLLKSLLVNIDSNKYKF